MLAEALKAEVGAYIAAFAEDRDEQGHRLVVRNGHHQPRAVLTSAGAVEVTAPRVNDKRVDPDTGERQRLSSAILPAWARKTPKVTEVLPLRPMPGTTGKRSAPRLPTPPLHRPAVCRGRTSLPPASGAPATPRSRGGRLPSCCGGVCRLRLLIVKVLPHHDCPIRQGKSPATTHPINGRSLGKPVSRRTLLRTTGAITGALGTLAILQDGAIVPQRLAMAAAATAFPDVQFDLGPFMPPAVTYDGIPIGMPPVHAVFLTATLDRAPSKADAGRMESALRTIEANYPYAPGGIFTHVAYSDNYFNRLPASVVNANMPRTLSGPMSRPARTS
jgi:hypothetical protein